MDVWDVPCGGKPVTLPSLPAPPWRMAFAAGGGLAVSLPDGVVLYGGTRFRAAEVVRRWDRQEYTTSSFTPDGRRLLLDTQSLVRLVDLRPPFPEVWCRPAPGGRATPGGAAFAPDGRRLAVAARDTVEVRDADTGVPVASFDRPAPTARWMGFKLLWSPDGRWVCEVWQQWLNVWAAATGRPVFQRVAQSGEWIHDAAFHPPSGRLGVAIAGRADGVVRLFAPNDWREEAAYAWPVGRVQALAFNPDGTLAAVGGDRPEVVLWDVDL